MFSCHSCKTSKAAGRSCLLALPVLPLIAPVLLLCSLRGTAQMTYIMPVLRWHVHLHLQRHEWHEFLSAVTEPWSGAKPCLDAPELYVLLCKPCMVLPLHGRVLVCPATA